MDKYLKWFERVVVVALIVSAGFIPWHYQAPGAGEWIVWAAFAATGLLGVIRHYLVVKAYGFAPASVVSPFFYAELIGAALLGFAVLSWIVKDAPASEARAGIVLSYFVGHTLGFIGSLLGQLSLDAGSLAGTLNRLESLGYVRRDADRRDADHDAEERQRRSKLVRPDGGESSGYALEYVHSYLSASTGLMRSAAKASLLFTAASYPARAAFPFPSTMSAFSAMPIFSHKRNTRRVWSQA